MAECRFYGECRLVGGLAPRMCDGKGMITTLSAVGNVYGRCGRFSPMPDRGALLELSDGLEADADRIIMAAKNAQFGGGPRMSEAKHDASEWRSIARRIREACGKAKA